MQSTTDTKKRYNIEIADVQLSILSDEPEDFVMDTVNRLDRDIRAMTVHNKRCAKIDAAILCALDSLGEKMKLEKKLKNLEAQVSLYEANLRRLRGDSIPAAPVAEAALTVPTDEAPAAEEEPTEKPKKSDKAEKSATEKKETAKEKKTATKKKPIRQITVDESVPTEDTPVAKAPEAEAPAQTAAPSIQEDKLKQIESLLRRRSEESAEAKTAASAAETSADSRDDKLRQIEDLLRTGNGSRSLSEALQDALHD